MAEPDVVIKRRNDVRKTLPKLSYCTLLHIRPQYLTHLNRTHKIGLLPLHHK